MPNLQDQLNAIIATLQRMGQWPPGAIAGTTVQPSDAPDVAARVAPVLSGTITGTYTLGGTPTITAPAISAPVFSGTATGTYTLGGTPTITAPTLTGTTTAAGIASSAGITSSSASAGIGYATGAGAAVTQATNRTTGVTINAISGTITTATTSLAAEAAAAFVVTNSSVAIGDVVLVAQRSGAVGAMTDVVVVAVAAGSFTLSVMNNNPAAGVAETGAIIINFCVIKAVSA